MPQEIKTDARLFASDCYMTDTYELAEIAARGCPPSIIDEPTPEQTPWRRRSIRLHEDAPRRTRPDVLISHAHESPAGLYRPRPSSYVSAAAQLFQLDALPSLGEREAGIQPARATSDTSPCSRSVKQNGSRVTLPPPPRRPMIAAASSNAASWICKYSLMVIFGRMQSKFCDL